MVTGFSFVVFGLAGGFAYLAYLKKQVFLSYGLASLGVALFLEGVRNLMGNDSASGIATFVEILNHIALGVGGALLAFVAATHGWRWIKLVRARRREAELAFQAKLSAARPETPPPTLHKDAGGRSAQPKRSDA